MFKQQIFHLKETGKWRIGLQTKIQPPSYFGPITCKILALSVYITTLPAPSGAIQSKPSDIAEKL